MVAVAMPPVNGVLTLKNYFMAGEMKRRRTCCHVILIDRWFSKNKIITFDYYQISFEIKYLIIYCFIFIDSKVNVSVC